MIRLGGDLHLTFRQEANHTFPPGRSKTSCPRYGSRYACNVSSNIMHVKYMPENYFNAIIAYVLGGH